MTRSDDHGVHPGNHHVHERRYVAKERTFNTTTLVILVSLLFVAVFGGALVGGVVSGDPSNGFFITVIVASGVAISLVLLASIQYFCCKKRNNNVPRQKGFSSKDNQSANLQPTFTRTADEDEEAGHYDSSGQYIAGREPVAEDLHTIHARSMAPGDVSAMSPGTYDYEDQSYGFTSSLYTHNEHHGQGGYRSKLDDEESYNGPFDFATVASAKQDHSVRREDPPEEFGGTHVYKGIPIVSRDPEAAVATADGKVIPAHMSQVNSSSPSASSIVSTYEEESDAKEEMTDEEREEREALEKEHQQKQIKEWEKRTVAAKSNKSGRTSKSMTGIPPPPPPRPVRSSKSVKTTPKSSTGTPATSEAGSTASSMFLKPFANMFAKKRAASEAGYSDASTAVRGSEVGLKRVDKKLPPSLNAKRPPVHNKKTVDEKTQQGLETIGGAVKKEDKYTPSSPGNNSTFSFPPPRRVPSTPGGASEAPSEFRSVAASSVYSNGVASSTFDAEAHERALRRMQNNAAALGAAFNNMPIYYEESETGISSAARSVARSEPTVQMSVDGIGYDVFAPPGPLGMVVDSVDKGCIVHSLKKNSPMQGLINPGDLIVALDDFNVRKMDAASLTRLMATKSQQNERKFTLIPIEQL